MRVPANCFEYRSESFEKDRKENPGLCCKLICSLCKTSLPFVHDLPNWKWWLSIAMFMYERGGWFYYFSSTAFTTVLGPTSQKWIWADPLVKSLNPCEWTKQTNILPINNWRSSPSLLGLETPSAEVRAAACWKGEAKWQPGWRCRKNRGIYQPFGVTILNG